jgi:hypothetical protein
MALVTTVMTSPALSLALGSSAVMARRPEPDLDVIDPGRR